MAACVVACGSDPAAPEPEAEAASAGPEVRLRSSTLTRGAAAASAVQEVVLARVGAASLAADTRPALVAAPRKLGVLTRNAVPAVAPFELDVPEGATRLRLSQACVAPAPAVGSLRFRIELRSDTGPWHAFHLAEQPPGTGWHDHELALPDTGGTRTLRFQVALPGGEPACEPLWGSVLLQGPGGSPEASSDPPNVVLVSLDTLGAAYLGSFSGDPQASPHLDVFLDAGASFRRAYAQYGNTLVSHASLFSALHPRRHGVYPDGLPKLLPSSLVETLSGAGYHTAAVTEGAFVSAAFGFARGFDHYDDGALGLSRQMAGGAEATFDRAAAWLEGSAGRGRFFLFVHSYEVHSPYLPRDADALRIAAQRTPGDTRVPAREQQARMLLLHNAGREPLSQRDLSRLAALHAGEVHALDVVVGRFLERLEAAGLAERTLVVVTSDHGDQFGEGGKVGHGDSLHDRVLHVPLGFRWPGVIARRRIETPVQLVDVMPTVLELAGLGVPAAMDGASLAPVLLHGAPAPERPAFSEQRSGRGECARLGEQVGCRLDRLAVHAGRWKLVSSQRPPWQRLYDLSDDPLEERDLREAHPQQAARLSALLDVYRTGTEGETGDPGPLPQLDAATLERLRSLGYETPRDTAPEPF